jgi:hypothetical protein
MKIEKRALWFCIMILCISSFAECKQYSQPKCGYDSPVIEQVELEQGNLVYDSVYYKKYIIYYSSPEGSSCYIVINNSLQQLKSITADCHSNSCSVIFSGDAQVICPDSIVGWYNLRPKYLSITSIIKK